MGTLSEKLTRIKNAMDSIRSGFDLQDAVIESVASTTTELHATQTVTIAENTATIQDLNTTLNARNNEINRLNATVTTQENVIAEQGATITNLNNTVDEQVVEISTLQNTIATKDETINELNETVLAKDNEIAELNERIEELENPSTPEPEYTYLTVAMRTEDSSSLPDDFTYSIDVYDADNNALYTNLSPDAISGEYNETAFSDLPDEFIVGNEYTITVRSWSAGYSLISDNPYTVTAKPDYTEVCFMLKPEAAPTPTLTKLVDGETLPIDTVLYIPKVEEYAHMCDQVTELEEGDHLVYLNDECTIFEVTNIETMGMSMIEIGSHSDGALVYYEGSIDNGPEWMMDKNIYLFDSGALTNHGDILEDVYMVIARESTVHFSDFYKNNLQDIMPIYKM